jgi:hypothetical protein
MIHIVESAQVLIHDLQVLWSPFWTVHVQYCTGVRIHNISIFNPNNSSYSSPNGDGIDVSSSQDVVVSDSTLDCSDDATAVRAGSGWAGAQEEEEEQHHHQHHHQRPQEAPRPQLAASVSKHVSSKHVSSKHVSRCHTEGVLFERIAYRNGHGLRCGEDAVGGIKNVTWRDIHVHGGGPVQVATGHNGAPGCVRIEAWPDDGGEWEDITWERVTGAVGRNGISWNENHPHTKGGRPNAWPPEVPVVPGTSPPLNVSSWVSGLLPRMQRITIKDVHLTELQSNPKMLTLVGAAVEDLHMNNVTLVPKAGLQPGWACTAQSTSGKHQSNRLCATGTFDQVNPPLADPLGKYNCTFSPCL